MAGSPNYVAPVVFALSASLAQAAGGNVRNLQTTEVFATIQAAIDDADTLNGHTLQMLVATHVEGPQIQFSKSITLLGAAGGSSLLCNGDTGTNGDARGWITTNLGTVCTFRDLAFDGNGFLVWQALRFVGDGTVRDCSFTDIDYASSGPSYQGTAIAVIDSNVTVADCSFTSIGRIGVIFFGDDAFDCRVEGMTYVGKGPGNHLDYAVEVGGGACASVSDLMASDCEGTGAGFISAGVICSTLYGSGSVAEVTLSSFANNTAAIAVGADGDDTSFVLAALNDVLGNEVGVANASFSNTVDARLNWWGDVDGPLDPNGMQENNNTSCFPPHPNPALDGANIFPLGLVTGDPVERNVAYCPWLEAPAMTTGMRYCPNNPNSTGRPATILATGSTTAAANAFRLLADDLPPNQFGYFLLSGGDGFIDLTIPGLSDGFFCLASSPGSRIGRFNAPGAVQNSGPTGFITLRIDLDEVPQSAGPPYSTMILPGETWYFQAWHRDAPPSSRNNFTDAIAVTFQ